MGGPPVVPLSEHFCKLPQRELQKGTACMSGDCRAEKEVACKYGDWNDRKGNFDSYFVGTADVGQIWPCCDTNDMSLTAC